MEEIKLGDTPPIDAKRDALAAFSLERIPVEFCSTIKGYAVYGDGRPFGPMRSRKTSAVQAAINTLCFCQQCVRYEVAIRGLLDAMLDAKLTRSGRGVKR